MSKQQNVEAPKKKWETKYLNVWDETVKSHVLMTLVESVQNVISRHDCIDYGIEPATFTEDPKNITSAMKKLGYYPRKNYELTRVESDDLTGVKYMLTLVNGPHKPQSGSYYFEHYTKRKKND